VCFVPDTVRPALAVVHRRRGGETISGEGYQYVVYGRPNLEAGKVEDRSMKTFKVAGLVVGAFLMMALPASAHARFRGGILFGPAISPLGWYSPFYYGRYWPYGYYGPYPVYTSNTGEIKLDTNVKDAEVFINGAYAGTAGKMKSIRLRPDAYNLEIRAPGYVSYTQRIYVVAGHTIRLHADLAAASKS